MATKKIFKTYYEKQTVVESETGSDIQIEYELSIDGNGQEYLKPCGETNLDDYIQSFKDSVDVNKILERVAIGDVDALNKVKGFYADVSDMDKNLQDLYNMNLRAENMFEQLPADIREVFGNSYYNFIMKPEMLNNYVSKKKESKHKPDHVSVNTSTEQKEEANE